MYLAISNSFGYYYFVHFILFTLGLSLKDCAKEFAMKMQESNDNVERGIEIYLGLKKKIHGLSKNFGTQLLFYFFGSTAYFITGPDIFKDFQKPSTMEKYSFMMYFSTYILCWTSCANFHSAVQTTLRNWLECQIFHQNLTLKPRSSFNQFSSSFVGQTKMQLESMERELAAGCPTLAISSKYFTVTTGFLGTV